MRFAVSLLLASSALATIDFEALGRQSVVRLDVPAESVSAILNTFPDLDVFPDPPLVPGHNAIRFQPDKGHTLEAIQRIAPRVRVVETVIPNLREHAEANFKAHDRWVAMGSPTNDTWFQTYHTYDELIKWYKELAAQYPANIDYYTRVGQTMEGRDIDVLHLHFGANTSGKPRVWLEGLIHAREWLAGATLNYVVDRLVGEHSSAGRTGSGILDQLDVFVVPVLNVDGYIWAWTRDRMWRKNRRLVQGTTYGVDLNRNFDDHWGGDGSSGTPSSETYRGTAPFSEPETSTVRNGMERFRGGTGRGFACAVDMHTYGQLILRPWGWTANTNLMNTPTEQQLRGIGLDMRTGMSAQRGCRDGDTNCQWTNQHAGDLYAASGASNDWFYSKGPLNGGVPIVDYTLEGRPPQTGPESRYGFDYPASGILESGAEILAGYLQLLRHCAAA